MLKAQILEFDRMITAMAAIQQCEPEARCNRCRSRFDLLGALIRKGTFLAWIGLVPSRTRAAARTGSAISASEATVRTLPPSALGPQASAFTKVVAGN